MARITPDNIDDYTRGISNLYNRFQLDIYLRIIQYLVQEEDYDADSVLSWQTAKLNHVRGLERYSVKRLTRLVEDAGEEISNVVDKASEDTLRDIDEELVTLLALTETSSREPYRAITNQRTNVMFQEVNVNVNQHLITDNFGRGAITQQYEHIIRNVVTDVITGGTIDEAVQKAVNESYTKGLPSKFIDRGGHTWSVNRYMDNIVGSTVNDIYNELNTRRMDEYGIHTVLVTSLANPAPRCQHIQGTVADTRPVPQNTSGYHSVYEFGYGTPGGTRGRNCRHQWLPFVDGVNTNNQPKYKSQEAEQNYQALQRQRLLERRIRASKGKLELSEALGDDNKVSYYKQLIRSQQAQIRELISGNDYLGRQYRREQNR